ncbi:unnamed protein product [Ilex paraguariensis]|uniref:Protein arginine N-methyltransferase domain-containing protein n=1 Tax=Ilex paraguariensis TaxID=185542 RepID=A0ABC8T0N4_9AQUA
MERRVDYAYPSHSFVLMIIFLFPLLFLIDESVKAKEVVKANNLSDTVIVLHGRIEDVEINEEVDVIVSEWMGYMLLYESMLGSVITARDRWLKPGGLIIPSNATLYMAPVTHSDRYSESIDFWRNVYGIDMSAMLSLAKQCAFEEPSVETITGENVLTWPHVKHATFFALLFEIAVFLAELTIAGGNRKPKSGEYDNKLLLSSGDKRKQLRR